MTLGITEAPKSIYLCSQNQSVNFLALKANSTNGLVVQQ
jgi:hypothetical protein